MSTPTKDPWARVRAATPARVGLGRSGTALPTKHSLEFQYAHARARDAVHRQVDLERLEDDLAPLEVVRVNSAAADRATYLRRPDLGRRLDEGSRLSPEISTTPDIVFVIADGLSADAVQTHAAAVTRAAMEALPEFAIAPVFLASQARVAIGDEIGAMLGARLVILLVGERPGLTVADSLGAYITYRPEVGRRDSERNCISNIHGQGGLDYATAARKIAWLTREALRIGVTGTALKEDAEVLGDTAVDMLPD